MNPALNFQVGLETKALTTFLHLVKRYALYLN